LKEIEGVGGGAGEGVLIEDLFGQGADEGLAAQLAAVVFLGAGNNLVDMEGAVGGGEYIMNKSHIRLTFWRVGRGFAVLGTPEGAQGAELSEGRVFKDLNEVVFVERVHSS